MELNLVAKNLEQERIKTYLQENVSEILADKINNGVRVTQNGVTLICRKDLDGFWQFASQEAKKTADKNATSAYVDDQTVFGWAVHYFEEDSITGKLYTLDGKEYQEPKPKETTQPVVKSEPKKSESQQASLFDLFDTTVIKEPTIPPKTAVTEQPDNPYLEIVKAAFHGELEVMI